VSSASTFFKQAAIDLPQSPELVAHESWDALQDNLWSCTLNHNSEKHAIVWCYPERLYSNDLEAFIQAVSVLIGHGVDMLTHSTLRREVVVLFLGVGNGFRSLEE
jgi:hypothetical protein